MAWAHFTVTDREAPRRAVAPGIHRTAGTLAADAADRTPVLTGRLRAGWKAEPDGLDGRVSNDVEYARFVEYGTRRTRPAAMLGRALAWARSQV